MTQPAQDLAQGNVTEEDKDKEYEKFHTFDFHGNVIFQAGWSKIVTVISEEKREAEYLKAKLFFYSKLYGKVTREGYEQWLNDYPYSTPEGEDARGDIDKKLEESLSEIKTEDFVKVEIKSSEPETLLNIVNCNYLDPSNRTDECQTENKTNSELNKGDNLDSSQMSELGFTEIAEMLEKGLKLPGVEELNIKPLDIDPNPAGMERVKKPWEK